jgi:hypothetical protein
MKKTLILLIFCLLSVGLFAQHVLYVPVENSFNNIPAAGDITFEAYVTTRPTEVLTESSGGCSWNHAIGYIEVQCATFPTQWSIGDIVHLDVIETSSGETGSGDYTLVGGSYTFIQTTLVLQGAGPTNPDPAQNPTPIDLAVDVPIDTNLSWEYNGTTTPDGYKLFLGTDNPPTNIVNGTDLGAVLTYDPAADFDYSTLYYWQIVPYTSDGDRTAGRDRVARTKKTEISRGDAQNCPVWSFTTEAEPVFPNAWINELHYDNVGTDVDEFYEVVIENAAGYTLSDFKVTLYNGSGGASYGSATLDSFTQGVTVGNYTIYYKYHSGIQNGEPDGLALDYLGNLIPGQFLSYEGTFTATNGPANGVLSTDIGVAEIDSPVGNSLQLSGVGLLYSAFTWQTPLPHTPGEVNNGQFIGDGPAPLMISNISREYTVPTSAQTCDVQGDITGGIPPYTAVIKYNLNGTPQVDIAMLPTTGDTYLGTLPALNDGDRVEYYIQVTDSGSRAVANSSEYHLFWGNSPISNAPGNIKEVDVNGILIYNGYYCTVTGIASVANGIFSGTNLEVYIQDVFGGINVFKLGGSATIIEGNSYTVTGVIEQYAGKSEIIPDDPDSDIVDNGFVNLLEPFVITIANLLLAPEDYENTLIGIQHISKDAGTWGANQNLTVSDGTGSLTLRIDGDTDLDENPEPVWPKDVIGIFTQYDNSSPHTSGYQIIPRSFADIRNDGSLLILNPALATLVAPADGAVVPLGNLLLDWDYTGPAVTGFEVWLGYMSTDAATWIADVPAGTTAYTVTINEEATDFEWKIYPYIEESANRGNLFSRTKNKASRGNRERIYPLDAPVIWYFSSFDPTPQPPLPIPPAGGTANLNGGTTGNGGSGAGASITMTPTGTPPTGQIDIFQTTPGNLGVPFPDNALDIAFTISTTGTISDPITIKIEWDYPVPTAPTSGAPILLVNHGSGWVYHAVDSWDFSAPAYWIQFTTTELSDWVIGDGDDNPLPVTLSSFSGICVEGVPNLNWTTQSETDNLGWNVYRGSYENGWNDNNVLQLNSSIIAGMGTTSQITNYNFQDTEPVINGQTYFYWLQNVSLSGELAHFGPVTVLVEVEDEPIIIPDLPVSTSLNANYPNPFNPTTIIKFDIKEGESGKFTIYNLLGQKVVEQNFEAGYHTFHWNANNQASGVYFYALRTPSYLNTKKMILMK